MKPLNWQKRRNEFNHDWLKNKYIPILGTWMNLLDAKLEDDDLEKSFLDYILPEWKSKKKEPLALSRDFEIEMSPRILFNDQPLSNCDEDTKQWLGDLIHDLWLARYSVKRLVDDASKHAKNTNVVYNKLLEALMGCKDIHKIEESRKYRGLFSELLSACRELSDAIEKFPSEVKAI